MVGAGGLFHEGGHVGGGNLFGAGRPQGVLFSFILTPQLDFCSGGTMILRCRLTLTSGQLSGQCESVSPIRPRPADDPAAARISGRRIHPDDFGRTLSKDCLLTDNPHFVNGLDTAAAELAGIGADFHGSRIGHRHHESTGSE